MIKGYYRAMIQKLGYLIDLVVGATFANNTRLEHLCAKPNENLPISPQNFSNFTISQRSHLKGFICPEVHKNKFAYLSDLKVYQDLLIYNFIVNNFPPGSRLLEIGGGNSRIIQSLKNRYEFWNLDKLEGLGHGPKHLKVSTGFHQVYDFIGTFNQELPNQYFDGVYSISTLEHVPAEADIQTNILKDTNRVLKSGGWSFHCIDLILDPGTLGISNGIIEFIYKNQHIVNPYIPMEQIRENADLLTLSNYYYYTRWLIHTRVFSMEQFGRPLSYNILWCKEA